MEIVGRLCQTPMQKQRFVTAFHRNALRNTTIVFLISLLQTGPVRAAEAKIWEEFSGDKAFALVQRLVDFGPRPAGSDALEKSGTYIEEQLRLYGLEGKAPGIHRRHSARQNSLRKFDCPIWDAEKGGLPSVFVVHSLRHKGIRHD